MNIKPKSVEEQHYYILGENPTKEAMDFYNKFRTLHGVSENDGLWPIVIAMQGLPN